MIYRPNTEGLWDCWIYPANGKYYMYYLSLSPERIGKGTWDGISLAISEDLVHWQEYGRVLTKSAQSEWIGTGMIQKIGSRYIMNFSEEYPRGHQKIYFAVSEDLLHWERTEHVCQPDGIHYMNQPTDMSNSIPRWDSLGVVDAAEDHKPPYYAFCTASGKQTTQMNKNGALGLVTSMDGLNWKCLPNAFVDTDTFPQFEVPEHVAFEDRHYVLFCTSSHLGFRFDKRAHNMSGGTFYVVSDQLLGPYRLPEADCMLQGTRDHLNVSTVTVGRPLKLGDQIVYYHIWSAEFAGSVGTVKILEEAEPYHLRLRYHPTNDHLKHTQLARTEDVLGGLTLVRNIGAIPPMEFDLTQNISFTNLGTSAALNMAPLSGCGQTDSMTDLRDGRFITFQLQIEDGEGAGLFFEATDGARLCLMLNRKRQCLEFGYVLEGWGPNVVLQNQIRQACKIDSLSHVKVLARRNFIEVYLDDLYVSSWRPDLNIDPNRLGFYFEDCSGTLSDLEIWQMG